MVRGPASSRKRRRRRRRSLFRIVHARGAIPNEVGPTRGRATPALDQSADETRTPASLYLPAMPLRRRMRRRWWWWRRGGVYSESYTREAQFLTRWVMVGLAAFARTQARTHTHIHTDTPASPLLVTARHSYGSDWPSNGSLSGSRYHQALISYRRLAPCLTSEQHLLSNFADSSEGSGTLIS